MKNCPSQRLKAQYPSKGCRKKRTSSLLQGGEKKAGIEEIGESFLRQEKKLHPNARKKRTSTRRKK